MQIKKKKDGNWEYCVYLGQDNGKKKYKRKCGFKTKRECILEASLYENKINSNRKTLEDVFWLYYENKEIQGLRMTTLGKLKNNFNVIQRNFKYSDAYIDLITPEHIKEFIRNNYFSSLAPQTKNILFSFFKSIFTFAMEQDILTKNIFNKIPSIKQEHEIRNIWNNKELKKYLTMLKNFKYFDIVLLALETGMRKGEILGLTWDCVDFENKTIFIKKNLVKFKKEFYLHKPKTKAGIREIILFKDSLEMLKNRYKNRKSNFVFHDLKNCNKPLSPNKLTYNFRSFLKKHGIRYIHFHDLRHIHATFLLNNKVDYKILSKRLGHSNIAFTLQTYTHVLSENEKKALYNLPKVSF